MVKNLLKYLFPVLTIIVFLPCLSWAGFEGEQLVEMMPKGYKMGWQTSHNGMNMQEWVPEGETVYNWTEMLTTQVFLEGGKSPYKTGQLLEGIGEQWLAACKGSKPEYPIKTGKANGYPVSVLYLRCPLNSKTGKPENTLFRAIKGNDSFYVIQKAFKFEPTREQLENTTQYFATVNVCDTRTPEHPCPDLKAQGFHEQK